MAVAGIFTSDSSWQGDKRIDFVGSVLRVVSTGDTPLYALTAGTRDKKMTDTIVRWREQGEITGRLKITGAPVPAQTGTSIVLEDTSMIARNSILIIENTGEHIFVVGVAGYTVTVIRGWAGSIAMPIVVSNATASYAKIISRAFEEGSDPPPGYTVNPSQRFNLAQIFRSSGEITGTADAVNFQYGSAMERSLSSAVNDHAMQMENALMFGRRSESVQNGKPLRTMNGLFEQILTNRFTVPVSGMSYDMMDSLTEVVHGRKVVGYPNERIFFGGNRALTVMNKLAKAHSLHHVDVNTRKFGLQINTWVSTHGEIKILTHPQFNSQPLLQGCLVAYHPGLFQTCTLRPTSRQNLDRVAGRDTKAVVFTTEMSCKYGAEDTGTLVNGLYNADPN
jgi:hypothetical protein